MNAEEVCAMMDAITEGREYRTLFEGIGSLQLVVGEDGLKMRTPNEVTGIQITNPRTAREIAVALVTWADQKEGTSAAEMIKLLENFSVKPDENKGRTGAWREEWYLQNVRRMTRETMTQSMKDLREIHSELPSDSEEAIDIQKAMNILHDSLMGIKPHPEDESQTESTPDSCPSDCVWPNACPCFDKKESNSPNV